MLDNVKFVLLPENVGSSVWVATELKFPMLDILVTILVALIEKLFNLSTALIKYVPVLAGTEIEVAGLDTFSIKETLLFHSAPLVNVEYLIW